MSRQYEDGLVSIIVPVYNAEPYIQKTIESVLAQTYQSFELLLIDDCSKDNSRAVIQECAKRSSRIVYHCLAQNSGAAVARNEGLRLGKGRYAAFLDSDDTWEPDKLEKQIDQMRRQNIAFSYTTYDIVGADGEKLKGALKIKPRLTYRDLLTKTMVATPTVVIDRCQTGDVSMPNRRTGQDYGFWLKLLHEFDAYGLDEVLVHVCRRGDSLSRNKLQNIKDVWEVQTLQEKIGKIPAGFHVMRYLFYVVNKRYLLGTVQGRTKRR